MKELLDFSVTGVNWIPTGMLLFCLVYWITVILGLFDMDTLDFDVDLDVEVEVEAEIGAPANGFAWLNNVLVFFNLKYIPFMVWLTFLALPVWVGTVYITWLFGLHSFLGGLVVYLPALFGGLFLAKFLTWPLVKVFKALEENVPKDAVGKIGISKTSLEGSKKGQVEVATDGNPVLVMARAAEGKIINKGEQVLVIQFLEEENLYLVDTYSG